MLSIFQYFQKIIQDHSIKCRKESLNKIFEGFSYHLINEENDISDFISTNQRKNEQKIIYISEYIEHERKYQIKNDLFILCNENNIFIIEQSKIQHFLPFFSQNSESIIYTSTESVRNKIKEAINLPLQFSEYKNFDVEIQSFSKEFILHKKCIDNINNNIREQLLKFVQLIIESISGFLIQKSYHKLKTFDRICHITEYFSDKQEIKDIDQNKYIRLRPLNKQYRNTYLIYYIEEEELLVLKIFFDENSQKLFQREKGNYMKINFPLFPKFIGSTHDFSYNGIIIEYINKNTLDKIDEMKLSNEIKMKIIFQIMIAIFYLHKNGFIYRDLKPNNILINEKGSVTIIDFDRVIDDLNESNTKDFQRVFSAPELCSDSYSNKVDIYSLGKIIEFIFSKEFSSQIPNEYSSLKEMCNKCLNEDENKRPNILQLIENFYLSYFSKITVINEYKTIQTFLYNDIMILMFDKFLFYLSEYDHPVLLYLLGLYHLSDLDQNNEFIQYFIKAADKNHADSQCKLGEFYLDGKYIRRDINKSIYYFKLAADQNHADSQYNLGVLYLDGKYIQQDINKSIYYFKLAVKQNHAEAQFNLGLLYTTGIYFPRNINKSIKYLLKAANQNHLEAQFFLGDLYLTNELITMDISKSIFYLTKAANQNHAKAQLNLGNIYFNGDYVQKDIAKSIHYYTLAAQNNQPIAQFYLGIIYISETYWPLDVKKSIYYLELASNQNHSDAQFSLGKIYYTTKYHIQDINKAIYYFELAANNNHLNAQYYLATIYFALQKQSPGYFSKSIHYLTLTANQNIIKSQFLLGKIYIIPEYGVFDIDKSIDYFKLAANNNHSDAQYHLGIIYYEKQYFHQDIDKAIYYFTLASNNNHSKAQYHLGIIYYEKQYFHQDIDKAIHYFTLAAKNNHSDAQYHLGIIYYEKQYFHQDIDKAIDYLTLASNNNHSKAHLMLGIIYYISKLIPLNIDKSIYYLNLAAKNNDSTAQFILGYIYIKRDINKAIHHLTLAAKNNNSDAQSTLGLLYYTGEFIACDVDKSIYYLTLAAKNNNSEAQYNLGFIYYEGKFIARDITKSIYYLTLAAKQNYASAQSTLGYIYYTGKFIVRDIDKSIYYLTLAAKQNNSNALFNLGTIYLTNKIVPRDINKTIKYLTKASNLNDSKAQFNLGLLYDDGIHISRDIKKAIYYYRISANQGLPNAQHALGIKYFFGEYYKKDLNRAIYYFTLAAEQNYSESQYVIGLIYAFDKMFKKCRSKGIEYLIRASENNSINSSYILGCFYLRGFKGVNRDIDESIRYFKKGSSFYHQYSKNNLGIIYKIIKNETISIEYFEEAIKQKEDLVSMYNLGQMYFYGLFDKVDIDKSIDLLIKSSNKNFIHSKVLLSIVLIKKISPISIEIFIKEIENYENMNKNLIYEICEIIQSKDLLNDSKYKKLSLEYSEKYFVYNYFYKIEEYSAFMNYEEKPSNDEIDDNEHLQTKIIKKSFYDGFGKDIL